MEALQQDGGLTQDEVETVVKLERLAMQESEQARMKSCCF
jgi:hypothetical protein